MSALYIFMFIVLGVIIVILGYFVYVSYFGKTSNSIASTLWLENTNTPIAYNEIVNPTSVAYTFSTWIYINTWPIKDNTNIFNCKSSNSDTMYFSVNLPDNTPSINCVIATDAEAAGDAMKENTIVITNNLGIQRWVHLVISVNANIVDCYIDGKLVTSQQLNGMTPNSSIAANISTVKWDINFGKGSDIYLSNFKRTADSTDPASVANNYRVKPSGSKTGTDYSAVLQINKNNQPLSSINLF